jgi:hypothetical protein
MTRVLSQPGKASAHDRRATTSPAPGQWRRVLGLREGRGDRNGEPRRRKGPGRGRTSDRPLGCVPIADRLVIRAESGGRIAEAEKRGLSVLDLLRVQRAERQAIHRLSPERRLLAYRRRRFSAYQLSVWWSAYPREIPRIDGHPEWIAVTLVDVCEHPEYRARLRRAR